MTQSESRSEKSCCAPTVPTDVKATASKTPIRVPFCDLHAQYIELKSEIDAVYFGVMEKSAFIGGEHCNQFEKELAASVGLAHGVGTSCCTSALGLTMRALGIGKGDEVITTVHTAVATAEAITSYSGAEVKFVDIGVGTPLLDPILVEKAVTPRTKAIIPVHLYGNPCDMDAILDIARRRNLIVIEDCAQAQGAEYKGKRVGSMGRAACFSFFPSKNLGCAGDGGGMCTNDSELARKVKMMANHGRLEKFTHEIEGGNFRLDNLQAGILRVKLPHLDRWNEQRRRAAALYMKLLSDIPGIELPFDPDYGKSIWHIYAIQVDQPEAVAAELKKRGIGTGFHYPLALNQQPAFARLGLGPGSMPRAERFCARTLSLPMFAQITEGQVRDAAEALREVMKSRI